MQLKAALMSGSDQPIEIHILAIINSFVLVMLILSLLLLVIIRVVRLSSSYIYVFLYASCLGCSIGSLTLSGYTR